MTSLDKGDGMTTSISNNSPRRRTLTNSRRSGRNSASGPSNSNGVGIPPSSFASGAGSLGAAPSANMTLWQYLLLELGTDHSATVDKSEEVINLLKAPLALEKVMLFGAIACLDTFLYAFTILPLRVVCALYLATFGRLSKHTRSLNTAHRGLDIIKGIVLITVIVCLMRFDTSKIYHNIRGQAAIKLYVMFNVLEIADKLCSALGQEISDCLQSQKTAQLNKRLVAFALLEVVYGVVHATVILYQMITLNVAVNSYSNALLSLLLSNQFSEIKSAVFKKFERENLFQMTCADITERFQLLAMLFIIGLRNVVEVNISTGIVPNSWAGWNRWFGALFGPMVMVLASEVAVDWLKHAYVTKFNNIRPSVYTKFLWVLTTDYAENAFSDHILTKRTGMPIYPLAAVCFRMGLQSFKIFGQQAPSTSSSGLDMTAIPPYLSTFLVCTSVFVVLVGFKLVLGAGLFRFSVTFSSRPRSRSRDIGMENSFMVDEATRRRLYHPDEPPVLKKQKDAVDYDHVTRFKMVAKRIW